VAQRLGDLAFYFYPPLVVQNIFAALLVGVIVAAVSILWQKRISDDSAAQATRLENLRFVRQLSSEKDAAARPFSGLDLQGQSLGRLDLTGADLDHAKLQDADFSFSHLGCIPHQVPHCANLIGADLTGAKLVHTDLTGAFRIGVHYNEKTNWPVGFKPPPSAKRDPPTP
jgi:uncharacterized protein YjbI with pentapeptide repeats